MSENVAVESTRRRLTGKRADTVRRLSRATVEVLREVGYHDLTLQAVAAQAGVARATAYTYFSSKDHLIAEVYWRRLSMEQPPANTSADVQTRVFTVLRSLAYLVADEPALADAVRVVINSPDPDVEMIRAEIAKHNHELIAAAVADDADEETVSLLALVYAGAMMRAGTGMASFAEVTNQLEVAVRRILR
ncbi:MAG: TetR family transcriptional regulator [Mycobacterium sp.]|uniref:TetR family transcriptional regulator n=1 Tax=Mycobacterium sp. TaxID=1785 RepID=UPI001EC5E045|nr:TetR family transcriptional regulator [Mycobacterium sp.]MBW0018876.1 TetR family transcriptional regulator [Mycobacterium sp.]